MKNPVFGIRCLFFFLLISCVGDNMSNQDLELAFKNPPKEAQPRTWMHAMSGNMSKAGITKDLEAMSEVGIGGFLLFNVTQGIPNGPIIYNSDEHHEMIAHAAKEAERLGLSFGVHNCDGWSSSGGPWVTPEESMKMVVWSESLVSGGEVTIQLPVPTKRENFYKDIAVLAYPSLEGELDDAKNRPTVKASDKTTDIQLITDGMVDDESKLNNLKNTKPWLQFNYNQDKTIRSIKAVFNDRRATAILQTSKDGITFKNERELFKVRTGKGEWAINDHFEGITSKIFRLQFNQTTTLKEVELTSTYYLNNPLGRTSIARTEDHALAPIGNPTQNMIIAKEGIKDLSEFMNADGVLKTELPEGDWTILRFGYTSTGAFNNPASDEGRGLEVDKLSRPAFKKHYDAFVGQVVENTKEIAPNALQYAEIDSYEMGGQNWTEGIDSIFQSEKGYDLIKMLPLVTGRFVQSAAASEAVLYDYRDVVTNLMTKNYFQYFTELCNADGIQSYIEPYGFGPLNDLDVGGVTDIPMGEFWMSRPITQTASAVSSAHIYGKPVISAESFTSTPQINWKGHPAMAKTSGDLAWTYGINEFMFHRFAHQANIHAEPGMTMNRWGFHFDRTQTWWKNAGAAWFDYITRGSHLLRQGVPVADLLVYIGEGTPNSSYYRNDFKPAIPKQLNFDNVNTDVLLNRLRIEGNKLKLPESTNYRILVLKNTETLSLKTAKRLLEIAKAGITIVGQKPMQLSGYHPSKEALVEFKNVLGELLPLIGETNDWKKVMERAQLTPDMDILDGDAVDYAHRKTVNEDIYFFFNADSIAKTFQTSFRVNHKIPELWNPMTGEITKLAQFKSYNESTITNISLEVGESVFVVFREASKNTVAIESPTDNLSFSLSEENSPVATTATAGRYKVALSTGKAWNFSVTDIPKALDISDQWKVTFLKKHGYDGTVDFDSLIDWSKHPLDSIYYYSGTASYQKQFELSKEQVADNINISLDLGAVYIVAEVLINGEKVAVSWMPPFTLNITEFVKEEVNTIELLVTNQWSNRLIGDERYPANDGGYQLGPHRATDLIMPEWYINNEPRPKGERTTFTTAPFYKKDDPLMPSGVLGPVTINFSKTISYNQ